MWPHVPGIDLGAGFDQRSDDHRAGCSTAKDPVVMAPPGS
jgi:hypothetical protein